MLGRLFLLFTIVPVVELYLLITIGSMLGSGPTVGIVLATGMIGAWLAKKEGGRVLREWQGAVQRGEMPKEGLTSSLLVLVGGVLLVTPGVVTDLFGLSLLFPPTRRIVAAIVKKRVQKKFQVQAVVPGIGAGLGGGLGGGGFGFGGGDDVQSEAPPPAGEVIDVDPSDVIEKSAG